MANQQHPTRFYPRHMRELTELVRQHIGTEPTAADMRACAMQLAETDEQILAAEFLLEHVAVPGLDEQECAALNMTEGVRQVRGHGINE